MFKTKINDQGQIELWYQGENSLSLLGVYDSQEELDQARSQVQKQEERARFQGHTLKDGKRRTVVLRDAESTEEDSAAIQAVIICDDFSLVGKLPDRKIDLLISLGDLMDINLIRASRVYQPVQILAVRGNHDDPQSFPDGITDLHLQVTEFRGLTFAGFNGCWKYKGSGSYLYTQDQVQRMLDNFPSVDVFIAHNSPWGVHERDGDVHQGFQAFRDYIERVQPRYFFHGHQHVDRMTRIGETEVVGVYGEKLVEIEVDP